MFRSDEASCCHLLCSQALYNKLIDASYFVTIHWVNWRFIISVNTKNLESWIINCRNITVVNIVLLFTSFNSNYLCFRRIESKLTHSTLISQLTVCGEMFIISQIWMKVIFNNLPNPNCHKRWAQFSRVTNMREHVAPVCRSRPWVSQLCVLR